MFSYKEFFEQRQLHKEIKQKLSLESKEFWQIDY